MNMSMTESRRIRSRRGVTLTEVMVVTAIFTIISGALVMISNVYADYWDANRSRIELQQKMRWAVSRMSSELRQAVAGQVSIQNDGGEISFPVYQRGPHGPVASTPVVYTVEGGAFMRYKDGQGRVIADHVKSLVVALEDDINPDDPVLKVTLTGELQRRGGRPVTDAVEFVIHMRN